MKINVEYEAEVCLQGIHDIHGGECTICRLAIESEEDED